MTFLGYTEESLKKLGANITAIEICNQPQIWKETYDIIKSKKNEISKFLDKALKNENIKVILTGAGSSAFVGQSVETYLDKIMKQRVNVVETTDLVSHPEYYLQKDIPVLMISYARSGNSPESIATVELGRQLVNDFYHIALTCNSEGELAKSCINNDNELVILMPEKSNDKGFAMTGSFSAMTLSNFLIFNLDKLDEFEPQINKIVKSGENTLTNNIGLLQDISKLDIDRIVYLGANGLKGLARESALKVLELTSGKIATLHDSCMGFRHGPKSIVDDNTLIVIYFSNDLYARQYEMDFLKEITSQEGTHKVLAITDYKDDQVKNLADYSIEINEEKDNYSDDIFLLFDYLLNAQMLSIYLAIKLGVQPDNPSPSGNVNRVVKGVTIYKYYK